MPTGFIHPIDFDFQLFFFMGMEATNISSSNPFYAQVNKSPFCHFNLDAFFLQGGMEFYNHEKKNPLGYTIVRFEPLKNAMQSI